MEFNSSKGTIKYEKVGHGPHLCFLHGFCENSSLWQKLIAELKGDYSCLLIDLPGFGLSSAQANSIQEYAAICNELLEELQWKKVSIFGHSMGAYVALAMLKNRLELFDAIGLIHSTAYADTPERKESRLKVVKFTKSQGAEAFLKEFYPGLVAPLNLERLNDELQELVLGCSEQSIVDGTLAMMNRSDEREFLASLELPVLIICGALDPYFPLSDNLKQASTCSMAQINVFENVGHLSMLEAPQKLQEAMLQFLAFKGLNH